MSHYADLGSLLETQPDLIVYQDQQRSISARALQACASQLSSALIDQQIEPDSRVAVFLPSKVDATIAIYGILQSACSYIPLDPHSPVSRIEYILDDAQAACCIGSGKRPAWLKQDILFLDIDQFLQSESENDTIRPTVPERPAAESVAAILYTSGSSGRPRGVAISHRAIHHFVHWCIETFEIKAGDRIASLAPFHFDLSLFDLFTVPLSGATTLFIPESLKLAPGKLLDWIEQHRISHWYTVPSILKFLLMRGGWDDRPAPSLKQLLFAGEVFPTRQLKALMKVMPETRFYNLFGPTETNVCLYWPVDAQALCESHPIPIGSAAAGAQLKIEPNRQELLFKGPCLMNGYLKNGKLDLPLDEAGWFHTGDKVSLNQDGQYLYHGRLDRMIKSTGYRIEPAEIETVLCTLDGVRAAAVTGLADPLSGTVLCAAIAGDQLELNSLRRALRDKLPAYMQPARYKLLPALPLLSNGKTDLQAIHALFTTQLSEI